MLFHDWSCDTLRFALPAIPDSVEFQGGLCDVNRTTFTYLRLGNGFGTGFGGGGTGFGVGDGVGVGVGVGVGGGTGARFMAGG